MHAAMILKLFKRTSFKFSPNSHEIIRFNWIKYTRPTCNNGIHCSSAKQCVCMVTNCFDGFLNFRGPSRFEQIIWVKKYHYFSGKFHNSIMNVTQVRHIIGCADCKVYNQISCCPHSYIVILWFHVFFQLHPAKGSHYTTKTRWYWHRHHLTVMMCLTNESLFRPISPG